ncbi:MAG: tetratricopeptide repeat protein [Anaerolineae bacterium]|nr:tetratricopeptide repeat protein [Anaerolineae bacterium]
MDDLLQQAIAAARAGEKDHAKQLLIQVLKANPRSEAAWIWMSATVDKPSERVHCLKQVLAINPANELALKGLKALGALEPEPEPEFEPEPVLPEEPVQHYGHDPIEAAEYAPPPTAKPAPEPEELEELPPDTGGVPVIDEEVIARARREVEPIIEAQESRLAASSTPGIDWAEPEILEKKPHKASIPINPMILAIAGSAVLVIAAIVLTSQIISVVRTRQIAARITPSPTPTITATPVATATPLSTRTPTPEGREVPWEPMLPTGEAPRADLDFGLPTPTEPYIATPHRSFPLMSQARDAFHEGRYQDALTLIEQSRGADYDPVDAYYFEAMSLIELGDLEGAKEAVEKGLDRGEDFAPLQVAAGILAADEGNTEQARSFFEQAKSIDPKLIDAYLALAQVYLDEGNTGAALSEVQAAREIARNNVNVLVMGSKVYLASGDAENAAAYANLAAYIDPAAEGVVLAQARGRLAFGLYDLAIMGLESYLDRVNLASSDAWALLGDAYGQVDRDEDAQVAYIRALQISENNPLALRGRGLFYYNRGDFERAFADLSAALENSSGDAELRLARAKAGFELEEYEAALDDLEVLRAALPGSPEIETFYIRALIETGQEDKVINAANEALLLPLTPDQAGYVLEARSRAYYTIGDFDNALIDINQALQITQTGRRHYTKARILQAQGDIKQAIRELEWVLYWDQVFGYPFADDAAAEVEALYLIEPTPTPTPFPTPIPAAPATPTPEAPPADQPPAP